MGIRGLETFMEKYSDACQEVQIVRLIHQYRSQYNRTPVIVVDGMSVMRFIYKSLNLPWICGGQMKEYEETLKEFINSFLKEGAELVFYFDGPTQINKLDTWVTRRLEWLKRTYELFDAIEAGGSVQHYERTKKMTLPPGLMADAIVKKCGCKVYSSVRECDLEIAQYAMKNKVMAILAQDSDFIIFQAAPYYLSMKNFNFRRMTTLNYDSRKLASFLKIQPSQLALFASLVGNDIIPPTELRAFHESMLKRCGKSMTEKWIDFKALFLEVANFLSQFPGDVNNLDSKCLERIAHRVFSDPSKSSLVRESVDSYDVNAPKNKDPGLPETPDGNWTRLLRKVYELHRTAEIPPAVFSILALGEYSSSTCLEDYRKSDLPASQVILKPLRERLYGILLHEKPRRTSDIIVTEMVMCGADSLVEPVLVRGVKPNVPHPGLLSLWSGAARQEGWTLIGDIFKMDFRRIQALPPSLTVPALAFKYLREGGVTIEDWEWNALVSSACLVGVYSPAYLSRLRIEVTPRSTRSIRLYTLVTRSYSTVETIFRAISGSSDLLLSSDDMVVSNYQDGKLFQSKYLEAKHGKTDFQLCDGKDAPYRMFTQVMEFILDGEMIQVGQDGWRSSHLLNCRKQTQRRVIM